jgi:hypothetical protein
MCSTPFLAPLGILLRSPDATVAALVFSSIISILDSTAKPGPGNLQAVCDHGSSSKEKTMRSKTLSKILRLWRTVFCLVAPILLGGLLVVGSSTVLAEHPGSGGRPLTTTLTGAAEVPGPGDPDGSGVAKILLNQGQSEVCFELTVEGIAPATAAHIHVGGVGVAGPVVVALSPPTNGSSSGCTNVDPVLIKDIRQNPASYYVNVHNTPFPAGAVRGQLSK